MSRVCGSSHDDGDVVVPLAAGASHRLAAGRSGRGDRLSARAHRLEGGHKRAASFAGYTLSRARRQCAYRDRAILAQCSIGPVSELPVGVSKPNADPSAGTDRQRASVVTIEEQNRRAGQVAMTGRTAGRTHHRGGSARRRAGRRRATGKQCCTSQQHGSARRDPSSRARPESCPRHDRRPRDERCGWDRASKQEHGRAGEYQCMGMLHALKTKLVADTLSAAGRTWRPEVVGGSNRIDMHARSSATPRTIGGTFGRS